MELECAAIANVGNGFIFDHHSHCLVTDVKWCPKQICLVRLPFSSPTDILSVSPHDNGSLKVRAKQFASVFSECIENLTVGVPK